jgi:integrase
MSLTKRAIDGAEYSGTGNARYVIWDDNPRGLGLRVFPSGRKSFILSYRVTGRKRLMALGDFGTLTLDHARRRAKEELRRVEDQQLDPLVEKRKRVLEARTGTVEALFKAYIEARKDMRRPAEALRIGTLYIFPHFGTRPWREVRRSEVRDWHAGIAKPYSANRALQALRAAYYWRLWSEDDAAGSEQDKRDTRNPCAGIELRPETARQVRLEIAQLPKLEKAINKQTTDPYLRAFFRFLLATGCRRGEALKLQWQDVNLIGDTPTATFRMTKSGNDHQVPLSDFAVRLLKALPRMKNNPYVFVGHRRGTGLQSPSKAWQRIRAAAGLPHLRIHDLRRSFGSWLGDAGFTSKQIGSVLGHQTDITSRVYMAIGDTSKRSAVNAMQALMQGAGKKRKAAKSTKATS